MRLRHNELDTQIVVPNDKAERLIAAGTYKPVPDAEQPPPGTGERKPTTEPTKNAATSIHAAIARVVPWHGMD